MVTRKPALRSPIWFHMAVGLMACVGLLVWVAPIVAEEHAPDETPPGRLEFVGRNLFARAEGVFHEWRVVESSVDLDSIEDAFVIVEVALDSVDTGIDRRDRHLRDPDFFETETYPVANVRVHSPRSIEREATEGDEASDEALMRRFAVQFDIDLHGVRKTVEGEVRLLGTDPAIFEGDLVIDRTDFGIGSKPSRWNPMAPRAEIPVHFRVEI